MKKVIHERMAIYRHETQTVPSDVFLEVTWQGMVSFRRIRLTKVLIFLNTLRLQFPSPKSPVCIAGMSSNLSFFFSFLLLRCDLE